jgi:ribosome biogenesis GTPase
MMDSLCLDLLDFEALAAIGLGAAMRAQLACGVADTEARPMRLVAVQRDHLRLHDGHTTHRAQAQPALLQDLRAQDEALAVGDWVLARPEGSGGWRIVCRLTPVNQIVRRMVNGRCHDGRGLPQRQVLVSNVDTALLVLGLDHDFNLRRLERSLALVRLAGVAAVLVLSKADTLPAALCAQRLAQARALLPAGMAALALDLRQPAAAEALMPWLARGQTLVLLGSSGAGKSTLANTLERAFGTAAGQRTGAVRDDDSRGRHTTTVRTLLPLPGAACLIDTPGLRALRLDVDDEADLADAFGDVARLAPLCRFRDCRHVQEPGCAVREAVAEPRLRNFHKLMREARRDGAGLQERRAQLALWKARARAAHARQRGGTGGDGG